MANEGEFPKVDGDIFYASEANILSIVASYTGNSFDSNATSVGDDEHSYEMTALTASQIKGANYLYINVTCLWYFNTGPGTTTDGIYFKIQTKNTGGSYSDSLPYQTLFTGYGPSLFSGTTTVQHIHTLTANEKANGVQIKLFSKCHEEIAGGYRTQFQNKQVTVTRVG